MNGTRITSSNVSSAGGKIRNATIYLTPFWSETYAGCSAVNYRCLIAHEMGHALGFGHYVAGTASIMVQGVKSYTSLQSKDRYDFTAKYFPDTITSLEEGETE